MIQLGIHLLADGAERFGDAALKAVPELLGVDAVVDELFADVVEAFGDAQNFLGAFAAAGQRALHAERAQLALPGRRIERLGVAGLTAGGSSGLGRRTGFIGGSSGLG